jgi:hypothetical protein
VEEKEEEKEEGPKFDIKTEAMSWGELSLAPAKNQKIIKVKDNTPS